LGKNVTKPQKRIYLTHTVERSHASRPSLRLSFCLSVTLYTLAYSFEYLDNDDMNISIVFSQKHPSAPRVSCRHSKWNGQTGLQR